jgi:hypothetical protein
LRDFICASDALGWPMNPTKLRAPLVLIGALALGLVGYLTAVALPGADHDARAETAPPEATARYGQLPLVFQANRGQAPSSFDYVANSAGFSLGLGVAGPTSGWRPPAGAWRACRDERCAHPHA